MSRQLLLPLPLAKAQRFETFHGGTNQLAVDALAGWARTREPTSAFVWGRSGSGKTHLLNATCHGFAERGYRVQLLGASALSSWSEDASLALPAADLIAIDEVDQIVCLDEPARYLFSIFNKQRSAAGNLLVSSSVGPSRLEVALPDLLSRLRSGIMLSVRPPAVEERLPVLQQMARNHGLELTEEHADFLLRWAGSNLHSLERLLRLGARRSLELQRRTTRAFWSNLIRESGP